MLLTGCLASCQAASPYNQKHPQCQGVCLLEGANLLCLQPFGTFTQTVEFGAIGRHRVRAATIEHALQLLLDALRN